ncbi:hypothetical protein Moror_11614, partial [Moniliophthora roreri MCA 2997]
DCAVAAHIQSGALVGFDCDKVVNWARSIGKTTKDFVRTCKSFLQGFCIDFVPMISRHDAFWFTFELETTFWNLGRMNEFQVMVLQQLYTIGAGKDSSKDHLATTIMISPANTTSHTRLPVVTKINREVFSGICDALQDNEEGQVLLLGDIRDDTCQTVLQDLVEEDDLIHLKQLLKERRELFFPEYDDWPRTPSPVQVVNEPFSGDPSSFNPLGSTNLSSAVAMMKGHDVELPLPNPAHQQLAPDASPEIQTSFIIARRLRRFGNEHAE